VRVPPNSGLQGDATQASSLCLLLSLMAHEKTPEDGVFEASWDFHSKKTLGQLLHRLREQIDVPAELDDYLGVGVDKRNEIIHGLLTKRALRLADPKGRIGEEKELIELKREVKKRDVAVNKLLDALFAKYGTSNEALNETQIAIGSTSILGRAMIQERLSTELRSDNAGESDAFRSALNVPIRSAAQRGRLERAMAVPPFMRAIPFVFTAIVGLIAYGFALEMRYMWYLPPAGSLFEVWRWCCWLYLSFYG
jgi:hypothetical protein